MHLPDGFGADPAWPIAQVNERGALLRPGQCGQFVAVFDLAASRPPARPGPVEVGLPAVAAHNVDDQVEVVVAASGQAVVHRDPPAPGRAVRVRQFGLDCVIDGIKARVAVLR